VEGSVDHISFFGVEGHNLVLDVLELSLDEITSFHQLAFQLVLVFARLLQRRGHSFQSSLQHGFLGEERLWDARGLIPATDSSGCSRRHVRQPSLLHPSSYTLLLLNLLIILRNLNQRAPHADIRVSILRGWWCIAQLLLWHSLHTIHARR